MRASEQDGAAVQEERRFWPEAIAGIAVERFVFIDESAARTNLVRTHAWSPCGERAPGTAPCGHWERVTILGALGPEGIVAAMSIPAATDGAVFCAWLEQVLLPEMRRIRPDAVLVMDNLAAHKTQAVRALLDGSGFAYRYLPRYSPDLNPIEPGWALQKQQVRKHAPRTADHLRRVARRARYRVTPRHCRHWFAHAGYNGVNSGDPWD